MFEFQDYLILLIITSHIRVPFQLSKMFLYFVSFSKSLKNSANIDQYTSHIFGIITFHD